MLREYKLADKLIFILLGCYLFVDTINGFFLLNFGKDLYISVVYKGIVLGLIAFRFGESNPLGLSLFLLAFIVLALGEYLSILCGVVQGHKIGFLLQHIVKLLTPFLTFFYLKQRITDNNNTGNVLERILALNVFFFLFNMVVGLSGGGFSTYGGRVDELSVGVKGYFYAGNEVSMVWVVLAAFLLNKSYHSRYWAKYFIVALMSVSVGFLIATKTAILASVLLAAGVPLINGYFFRNLSGRGAIVFALTAVLVLSLINMMSDLLLNSSLVARLSYIYNGQGLIGLILSSREVFLFELVSYFFKSDSPWSVPFGLGVSYYAEATKYSAELDFADIFLWHGVLGLALVISLFFMLLRHSFVFSLVQSHEYARTVFLTNIILFFAANISGHVFTSGMLGFMWGCFGALVFVRRFDARSVN